MSKTTYNLKNNNLISSPDFYELQKIYFINDGYASEEDRKQRTEKLKFHIESGDYFASIASILKLIRPIENKTADQVIKNIAEDLIYLHENYKIEKK